MVEELTLSIKGAEQRPYRQNTAMITAVSISDVIRRYHPEILEAVGRAIEHVVARQDGKRTWHVPFEQRGNLELLISRIADALGGARVPVPPSPRFDFDRRERERIIEEIVDNFTAVVGDLIHLFDDTRPLAAFVKLRIISSSSLADLDRRSGMVVKALKYAASRVRIVVEGTEGRAEHKKVVAHARSYFDELSQNLSLWQERLQKIENALTAQVDPSRLGAFSLHQIDGLITGIRYLDSCRTLPERCGELRHRIIDTLVEIGALRVGWAAEAIERLDLGDVNEIFESYRTTAIALATVFYDPNVAEALGSSIAVQLGDTISEERTLEATVESMPHALLLEALLAEKRQMKERQDEGKKQQKASEKKKREIETWRHRVSVKSAKRTKDSGLGEDYYDAYLRSVEAFYSRTCLRPSRKLRRYASKLRHQLKTKDSSKHQSYYNKYHRAVRASLRKAHRGRFEKVSEYLQEVRHDEMVDPERITASVRADIERRLKEVSADAAAEVMAHFDNYHALWVDEKIVSRRNSVVGGALVGGVSLSMPTFFLFPEIPVPITFLIGGVIGSLGGLLTKAKYPNTPDGAVARKRFEERRELSVKRLHRLGNDRYLPVF